MLGGDLEGDVCAGVGGADHEDRALLQLRGASVVARVELGDLRVERGREVGDDRHLHDAGGDDDVVRAEALIAGSDDVPFPVLRQAVDTDTGSDGKLEPRRVGFEVVGHLAGAGERVSARREPHPG